LTDRVYISRHVLFDEKSFPFTAKSASPSDSIPPLSPVIDLQFPIPNSHSVLPSSPSIHPSSHTPNTSESVSPHNFSPLQSHSSSPSLPGQNIHPMVTRSKNGIFKPKAYTATKHPLSSSLDYVPTTYHQASKFAEWRSAMQAEFNALQSTGTWILVPSSSSQNVVGCKWVFRIKKKPDGTVDRYKARLVAKGFHQKEGLDYQETFSPVAKPVTIRILLTFAVQFNWFLHQLDISNAFLHGDLKEEALKSLGFTQSSSDASLFVLKVPVLVIVLVYVDDILVSGPDSSVCNLFIKKLSSLFPVKDLGPLHYFLGLEVQRTNEGLFLHQGKYLMDLLQKTKMEGAKPCSTPLGTTKLDHGGTPLDNPTEYRSIVGGLQYLTWTRPDISFAVNQVSNSCMLQLFPYASSQRILRFLKGTPSHGIWFRKGPLTLSAYSDADWAGCTFDRRSTGGFCVFLGSNLVSWSAKKQPTVARSSTEAEYRSLAHTAAEVTWICKVFRDFGFSSSVKPTICQDQIADIHTKSLSKNRFLFLQSKLSLGTPSLSKLSLRGCKDKDAKS
ncbi:unnamed protein product, partial [Prunus brigantina]